MGLCLLDVDCVVCDKISCGDTFLSECATLDFVGDDPREQPWVNFETSMDGLVAPVVVVIFIVSVSLLLSLTVLRMLRRFLLMFILFIGITEGTFMVPVLKHCDVGFESLSNRLRGFSLISRDGFVRSSIASPFRICSARYRSTTLRHFDV